MFRVKNQFKPQITKFQLRIHSSIQNFFIPLDFLKCTEKTIHGTSTYIIIDQYLPEDVQCYELIPTN